MQCYGCERRTADCHSSCDEYKAYRAKCDAAKEERAKRATHPARGVEVKRRQRIAKLRMK